MSSAPMCPIDKSLNDSLSTLLQSFCQQVYEYRRGGSASGKPQSSSNAPGSVADHQKKLDEECDILELVRDFVLRATPACTAERVAALRNRRNELSPIYRLPTELLALAFEFAVCDEATPVPSRSRQRPVVVDLSHVSQRWRHVSVSTPKLWTNICDSAQPFLDLFIARSKTASLTVTYTSGSFTGIAPDGSMYSIAAITHFDAVNAAGFLPLLAPHIDRCRSLTLQELRPGGFERFLLAPAPRLEVFHAELNNDCAMELDTFISLHTFFGGQTPLLRDLLLQGVYQPLTSPIYRNLTRLRLSYVHYQFFSIHHMLAALANCPSMEELALSRVAFSHMIDQSASLSETHIHLSHLRRLELGHLETPIMHDIFTFVSFPPFLQLNVTLFGDGKDIRSIFPLPVDFHALPSIAFTRHLKLEILGSTLWRIQGRAHDLSDTSFNLMNDSTGAPVEDIFSAVERDLPILSEIESLALKGILDSSLSVPSFVRFLRRVPTITSLTLESCSPSFVNTLVERSYSLCPLLTELVIKAADVTNASLMDVVASRTTAPNYPASATSPTDLPTPTSASFAAEITLLRKLEISQCRFITEPTVRALKRLSVDVIWDPTPIPRRPTISELTRIVASAPPILLGDRDPLEADLDLSYHDFHF
ncbi:hypothetical protein BOTBODRAFT_59888 [Botryobasidium botryosum FD-172 SS1]|uniref:F-box domain-containing protein n=1 Tax=Botryobasidium botryosum (strain FD-172 SS1) TaxID=930990 RepID=A0A067LWL1_BOTB1|nr:hypothetical protein BOTBODRAFT_59888 [Botryobasidium botryosum FD-172 SS1]